MCLFQRFPTQRWSFRARIQRVFGLRSISMEKSIVLTEQEKTLRQLLLDTSNYISTIKGCTKPELRFTGGWVRDKLLGLSSKDIDVSISTMTGFRFGTLMKEYLAQPDTKSKYSQDVLGGLAKIEANPEKSKHLETVTTKILGLEIDLVNLRKETYAEDSRNPTMEFGTPEDDAVRRDATVNALFYNLNTSEVEDFTGQGLDDMQLKIIRTPLPPYQTFKDDPLRVLRCIRFASRLGFKIDCEAEQSMNDWEIKDALRIKISRERVGIEITKMLKGPYPYEALCLIDRLGLYNIVFTNPLDHTFKLADTGPWKQAYNQLLEILNFDREDATPIKFLQIINSTLIRDAQELHLAWLLGALVPWAKAAPSPRKTSYSKPSSPVAAVVAREGIKIENKVLKIIEGAVLHLQEVKDAVAAQSASSTSPLKRKLETSSREAQGMAIRRWGSHWRSNVMFALLVQASETQNDAERRGLLKSYAAWLAQLKSLDLLDVVSLKPLVDGKQLLEAVSPNNGPWMQRALAIAMEWQLRNPNETDPHLGIAEVLERRVELERLGLGC